MAVIPFEDFLNTVDPAYWNFISALNEYLLENGCKTKIELKSSGHLISYIYAKKTVINLVFRKKGLIARIYGENIGEYPEFLDTLPEDMVKSIANSSVCKRLINPDDCNPRCSMGYDFTINGERFQKCRYSCFMLDVNEKNNPYIKTFIENEISRRTA